MKRLSVDNIYSWSVFNEQRQIDFSGHVWVRDEGNVVIDPVAISDADLAQLLELGGAALIIATNRDHARMTAFFRDQTGAETAAHGEDVASFPFAIDRQLTDGEEVVPGMKVVHLRHGKSPGGIAQLPPRRGPSGSPESRARVAEAPRLPGPRNRPRRRR